MTTTETQYWAKELCVHPERESECHCWQHFDGDEWLMILKEQPQFDKHCRWQFVENWNCYQGKEKWIELLSVQPIFKDKCNAWPKFTVADWLCLISNRHEFLAEFDKYATCQYEELQIESLSMEKKQLRS